MTTPTIETNHGGRKTANTHIHTHTTRKQEKKITHGRRGNEMSATGVPSTPLCLSGCVVLQKPPARQITVRPSQRDKAKKQRAKERDEENSKRGRRNTNTHTYELMHPPEPSASLPCICSANRGVLGRWVDLPCTASRHEKKCITTLLRVLSEPIHLQEKKKLATLAKTK